MMNGPDTATATSPGENAASATASSHSGEPPPLTQPSDPARPGLLIQLPALTRSIARQLPAVVIGKGTALAATGSRLGGGLRDIWLTKQQAARSRSLKGPWRALLLRMHALVFDREIERLFFRPTRETVPLSGLHIPAAARARGHDYFPVPRLTFEWAMSTLPRALERFAFVDYGAGRGRALLMACALPFEKAVGVEFSGELAEDCRMNIAQFPRSRMRCRDVECVNADIMDYMPPGQPAVHYFLDPVDTAAFLELAGRIASSARAGRHSAWIVCIGMDCDAETAALGLDPVALPLAVRIKTALFSPYRIALFRTPASGD